MHNISYMKITQSAISEGLTNGLMWLVLSGTASGYQADYGSFDLGTKKASNMSNEGSWTTSSTMLW